MAKKNTSNARKKKAPKTDPPDTDPPAAEHSVFGYRAIAARYEVTTKSIQDWIAKGLPNHGPPRNREFVFSETDHWVEAFRKNDDPNVSRATKAKIDKLEAEARSAIRKAEREDLEWEIEQGNLLPRDEYELATIEIISMARDEIMTLPKILARMVPNKYHKKLIGEGERKVRQVLEHLSKRLSRIKENGPD